MRFDYSSPCFCSLFQKGGTKSFLLLGIMLTMVSAVLFAGYAVAGPPLPVHTIGGVGGGAITPMAYLVNPEPWHEGSLFGKPAATLTYVNMGQKNLTAFSVSETFAGCIEFSYAANRLGLGTLSDDILAATTVDIGSDLWLHHLNVRGLLIDEGTTFGGLTMPAITAGVHFKVNEGIDDIDQQLGGALTGIGYRNSTGLEYTLTATKTMTPAILGRPLILSGGLRASQAAQLGFLGFGDDYNVTLEGNIAYLPFDWLVLAYEYRQKPDPYGQIPGLIGNEDSWHALDAIFILDNQTTFTVGYGIFGTIANTEENAAWWLQLQHEF